MLDKIHELEALRKDGTLFPIRISFGSHSDDKNTITVANITDISKEKEQEAFLIQQSKMASMGEMIGNIAHQWRQPLSAISTIASGIKVEKEFGLLDDETLGNRLDGIVDKTNYLSQTIDDFRNFFQQSKDKEEFVVNDVLKNTEQIIAATYKINDINICKNYDENKGIVCIGFANELSQVIINILNNAKDILVEKDYEEKVVKINLIEQNNNILIEIFDNAGGIPDTILPKIFEPYFTTKHQSQGTGIGLYMSSEIINSHFKGSLTASNENFIIDDTTYYGACFKINIPVS
jgi:signal transduction histidine kinase